MHGALKKIITTFIFPLLSAPALAQDPAAEILTILSDQRPSPLDLISDSEQRQGLKTAAVLELLSRQTTGDNEKSALDFVSDNLNNGIGALDFISLATSSPNMHASNSGFGISKGLMLPFYVHRVTSGFGYRPKFGRMHKGIDLAMPVGDTIRVPLPGTVRKVCYEAKGYGHYVTVVHDDGLETRYAHLSRTFVLPGQRVNTGEAIALSGNSGNSTGSHLHFETRYLGIAVNPADIFSFSANLNPDYLPKGSKVSHPGRDKNAMKSSRRTYVVRHGDTIKKISLKTGISSLRLCQLNLITESEPLEPGRMIKLR